MYPIRGEPGSGTHFPHASFVSLTTCRYVPTIFWRSLPVPAPCRGTSHTPNAVGTHTSAARISNDFRLLMTSPSARPTRHLNAGRRRKHTAEPAKRLERHANRQRIVDAQHRLLVELLLVQFPDRVDLPAAPFEVVHRIEQDEHERVFLHDDAVRASELTLGVEDGQAVGKARRDLVVDERAELAFGDDAIWFGRSEEQLGPRELQRPTGGRPGERTLNHGPRLRQRCRLRGHRARGRDEDTDGQREGREAVKEQSSSHRKSFRCSSDEGYPDTVVPRSQFCVLGSCSSS